jgi:peptide chain release factor 1
MRLIISWIRTVLPTPAPPNRAIQAVTQRVEHVALDAVADRHRDRVPGVGHLDAADQSVGRLHRDGADQVVAEVLGDLQRQGLRELLVRDVGVQSVEQLRHRAAREFDVDDGSGYPHHAAVGVAALRVGRLLSLFGGSSHILFAS